MTERVQLKYVIYLKKKKKNNTPSNMVQCYGELGFTPLSVEISNTCY